MTDRSSSLESERNRALLAWYERSGRDLPWRRTRDPYAILVSEVMAQQTQVSRVVPFYEGFLETFPTVEVLAAAPQSEVVRAWNGLGYNARARRLHQAAQIIAREGWPRTVEGLERLPGVGPYTARAVAAIAFGASVAAVDTNVRRVLSRWHGEPLTGSALEAASAADVAADAAAWNQAVMDLGAAICTPRAARCDVCPVTAWCSGPDVYQPPRAQPRFEGSLRQIRGAVVRALTRRPQDFSALVTITGAAPDDLEEALEDLVTDGLATEDGAEYRLAD